jgi:hypothetical protein
LSGGRRVRKVEKGRGREGWVSRKSSALTRRSKTEVVYVSVVAMRDWSFCRSEGSVAWLARSSMS